MRVTLMNAISLDGFIAHSDGNTDWVDDFEEWEQQAKKVGAIIVGRKTFDEIQADGLWEDVTYFVLTGSLTEHHEANVECSWSPQEAIDDAAERGFTHVMLCGGSESNGEFAKAGLIDEVVLNIHPVMLGRGKPLLGDYAKGLSLTDANYIDRGKYVHLTAMVKK